MDIIPVLQQLCGLKGLSGFEHLGHNELIEIFKSYCHQTYTDPLGNVIGVIRCGKENAKKALIEAHFDQIGLMVSGIDDKGFITIAEIGGVDPRTLPATEVVIHGKEDVYGVIGQKPPHLISSDDMKKAIKIDELYIDTGYNAEEIKSKVELGDPITIKAKATVLGNNGFCGGALDDRAGIAALLWCASELQSVGLEVDLYIMASVQEELGCRGAGVGAYGIDPDFAIAVDVTHGDTPDGQRERTSPLGKGGVICKGPNLHPKLVNEIIRLAKVYNIPYQIEVEAGNTGTNAWQMQVARSGIPCALISIPLKYMHTPVEALNIEDIKSTAHLMAALLKSIKPQSLEELLCL